MSNLIKFAIIFVAEILRLQNGQRTSVATIGQHDPSCYPTSTALVSPCQWTRACPPPCPEHSKEQEPQEQKNSQKSKSRKQTAPTQKRPPIKWNSKKRKTDIFVFVFVFVAISAAVGYTSDATL